MYKTNLTLQQAQQLIELYNREFNYPNYSAQTYGTEIKLNDGFYALIIELRCYKLHSQEWLDTLVDNIDNLLSE